MLFVVVKAAGKALPPKVTQRDCPHSPSSIPIGAKGLQLLHEGRAAAA